MLGAVSLLGPVRMDYANAIQSVRAAARELSRVAEEIYTERIAPRRDGRRRTGPSLRLRAMATTERDYYDVLGVSRSADEREIKRAFRHKARELHPDVSDAPEAEYRFKEVVEAYEVLSKAETRSLYDQFGHAGLRSGGYQPGAFRPRQPVRSVLGVLRRRPVRRHEATAQAWRRHRGRGRDRPRRGGERHDEGDAPSRSQPLLRGLWRQRMRAGDAASTLHRHAAGRAGAAGLANRLRAVPPYARLPDCGGAGQVIEHPCPAAKEPAGCSRRGRSR